MSLQQLLDRYNDFHPGLHRYKSALFTPVDYIMSLKSKRIRPLLALVGYSLYKNDIENCLSAAHGLEIFHNFTLMHDDIMDHADLRRGQEATHIRFGVNEAIISGDAMAIMASDYIMIDCPDHILREALSIFNKTALEICIGQQMDMDFEKIPQIHSEEYLEMVRLKTAIFLGLALQLGAMIAGADKDEALALFKYGESLGIAFQIQDDLLDLTGDQEAVGKIKGGDILRNKKTLLICKAFEVANDLQKQRLGDLLNSADKSSDLVEKVTEIFEELNLFDIIKEEIDKYFKIADAQLELLNLPEEQLNILKNIALMIHARKG